MQIENLDQETIKALVEIAGYNGIENRIESISDRFPLEYNIVEDFIGAKEYASMWDYVKDGDISDYRRTITEFVDCPFTFDFKVIDDNDFSVDYDINYYRNGYKYVLVNWGEDELSFIPENELLDTFYGVYDRVDDYEAEARSEIFYSESDAKKDITVN